jgi:broad specificity phosphatase PhoE
MVDFQRQPMCLYLVRHGETEWSRSGQHTGRTDIPLTPRGEDEARQLVPWLGAIAFDRVLSSPSYRARRTCELAGLGPAVDIDSDLAEWDYGDYEGRTSADIKKERPQWDLFQDGGPNGEPPAHVAARADRLISRLQMSGGNIALFSHGHFSRVLAARWLSLLAVGGQHLSLDTGSLSILGHDPHRPDLRVIALWNAIPAVLR